MDNILQLKHFALKTIKEETDVTIKNVNTREKREYAGFAGSNSTTDVLIEAGLVKIDMHKTSATEVAIEIHAYNKRFGTLVTQNVQAGVSYIRSALAYTGAIIEE